MAYLVHGVLCMVASSSSLPVSSSLPARSSLPGSFDTASALLAPPSPVTEPPCPPHGFGVRTVCARGVATFSSRSRTRRRGMKEEYEGGGGGGGAWSRARARQGIICSLQRRARAARAATGANGSWACVAGDVRYRERVRGVPLLRADVSAV